MARVLSLVLNNNYLIQELNVHFNLISSGLRDWVVNNLAN